MRSFVADLYDLLVVQMADSFHSSEPCTVLGYQRNQGGIEVAPVVTFPIIFFIQLFMFSEKCRKYVEMLTAMILKLLPKIIIITYCFLFKEKS